MGLFHSILRVCSRSNRTTQKTAISPEIISHPRPLVPRDYPSRVASLRPNRTGTVRTTSHTPRPTSQIARPYMTLHSPAPSTTDSRPDKTAMAGTLRPPDLAHTSGRVRYSLHSSIGTGGRKLHKPRMVEGDWELIRRDVDGQAGGPGWKEVDTITGPKPVEQSQRNSTVSNAKSSKA